MVVILENLINTVFSQFNPMNTITASVAHTTKQERYGTILNLYRITLSNGVTAKRQSCARENCPEGANGVAINLKTGKALTASADVRRCFRKYKGDADVVVVNLRTEEVTFCG